MCRPGATAAADQHVLVHDMSSTGRRGAGGSREGVTTRIAEAFNVSIDYLLVEDTPRRPLHMADLGLASRLADIAELTAEDRSSLLHMLDALVTKNRLKALAGERG
jgi:hypothetical protein